MESIIKYGIPGISPLNDTKNKLQAVLKIRIRANSSEKNYHNFKKTENLYQNASRHGVCRGFNNAGRPAKLIKPLQKIPEDCLILFDFILKTFIQLTI